VSAFLLCAALVGAGRAPTQRPREDTGPKDEGNVSSIRQVATSAYTGMAEVVQPGTYSLITEMATLPVQLIQCAYPTADKFYGVLAAASLSTQNPPTLGGIRLKAGQPVYAVNVIRFDPGHRGGRDPHANVDRSLWFQSDAGQTFRLSFAEHPAHFRKLSTDTGLEAVLKNYDIPNRARGPLSDLSTAAGWQNFSGRPTGTMS
jgi:hypothetical protein